MSDFNRFGKRGPQKGPQKSKVTVTPSPKFKGEWSEDGKTPKPFNYKELMTKYRSQWPYETYEDALPRDGFVTDVVLNTMGIAAPLSYWVWAALFAVSTVLKRDAYIKWGEDILIANLFTILVGPPGKVKKTTVVNFVEDMVTGYEDYLKNRGAAAAKKVNIMRGVTTQESLHTQIKKRGQRKTDALAGEDEEHQTSTDLGEVRNDAVLLLPELTAAISKNKRYLDGLLDKLTSLYDGRKAGEDAVTQARGVERLQNIHFNMLGATTMKAIKTELPDQALGGGFLSRTMFVFADTTVRSYMMPMHFEGCPSRSDLKERLAWIADNCVGEYTLSPEALVWYADWYADFEARLDQGSEAYQNVHSRMNTVVLRVGMLLCCCRYDNSHTIEEEDLVLATVLLDYAYQSSMAMIDLLSTNEEFTAKSAIKEILQEHGKITRLELWKRCERFLRYNDFTLYLQHLFYEDVFRIEGADLKRMPSYDKTEVYVYQGERDTVEARSQAALGRLRGIRASREQKMRMRESIAMQLPYGSEEGDEHLWNMAEEP